MRAGVAEPSAVAGRLRRRRRRWRPSILDFYLIRGVTVPLLLVTAIACLAMMLERALRLVQEMAAAGAHLSYFLPLLGQLLPYYVGLALPAAFMIALILLMARMDESLELEAILASGVSFARIAAPLVLVGLVVAAASVAASGFLEPHGRYNFRSLKRVAINAGRIPQLQPGAFYSPAEGLTMSVDRAGPDGRTRGVFVRQGLGDGRELVMTAAEARVGLTGDGRELEIEMRRGLHLRDGSARGDARPFLLTFEAYGLREPMLRDDTRWDRGADAKELTVAELIEERGRPDARIPRFSLDGELLSRLARSLTIPLLPLLALPLAFGPKRARRSVAIILGFVVLMVFNHGLNFAKNLAFDGAADPRLTIALITAGFTCAILWLFRASRHLPSHSPVTTPLARAEALLARIPRPGGGPAHWGGGRMGGYVARAFLAWTFAAATVIILLLQMVDIFDLGDAFVERGFGWPEIGRYAWLRLPPLFQQSIGMASLAGAIMAFLRLSRFSEIVAMRGAGVSQYRLLLMALPAALALSFASFAAAEYAAPRAQLELAQWWQATKPEARGGAKERWFRIGGDIVRAAGASTDGRRLEQVTLYRRGPDGLLTERIAARSALAAAGGWTLLDATRIAPGAAPARHDRRAWKTPLRSEDVRTFFAAPPHLSADTARRALEDRVPVSAAPSLFHTRLQRIFAEPLAPIVMLLIALPLAFGSARFGPSWGALLYAIGGGLLFIVVDGTLVVAAQIGAIDPWVGAWAAPLVFGLLATTVLVWTER
jgi:LPS export ABC transporter permease LptG/LPS export ABC transporter permease LptF